MSVQAGLWGESRWTDLQGFKALVCIFVHHFLHLHIKVNKDTFYVESSLSLSFWIVWKILFPWRLTEEDYSVFLVSKYLMKTVCIHVLRTTCKTTWRNFTDRQKLWRAISLPLTNRQGCLLRRDLTIGFNRICTEAGGVRRKSYMRLILVKPVHLVVLVLLACLYAHL